MCDINNTSIVEKPNKQFGGYNQNDVDRILAEATAIAANMEAIEKESKEAKKPEAVPSPDPLWPVDAVPTHLTMEQKRNAIEVGSFVALKEADWKCERCGREDMPSPDNPRLCKKCAIVDKNTTQLMKKTNSSWMDDAKEFGLEIFERQPEETNTEWMIWETYRNYYPGKLPTWSALAEKCGVSISTVVKASQRWSFKLRILEWARHCDAQSQEDRVLAVKEMNLAQNKLATTMLEKVNEAMEKLVPDLMKPNEIVNMAKLATELQKRTVEAVPEKIQQPGIVDKVSARQEVTRAEDLAEIAEILKRTGALDGGKTVGIEQSTRIVIRGGDEQ